MITSPRAFSILRLRRSSSLLSVVWLSALALFATSVTGQTPAAGAPGAITGVVSNTATRANLEGAEVTLEPGNVSVITARDGRFVIPQVAPGTYTLTVRYSGLDPQRVQAQVTPGATSNYQVGLSSEIYQLSKFVVEGEREGNALAITQRRNAPNVKDVLSSDAFGNVADLNLGNFLLRMPGMSKEESEGEIIRIQVRGVNSDLSAVSIDGTRGSSGSTRSFSRGFEIDKVPADFIETIEVTKAATPDIDADSIGGAVNLKTKSALDRKGRRATYQFGNSYNMDQKSFRPMGSISYSDILVQEKLGVLFTASYNESHKPRDRSNIDFERTTDTDRPVFFSMSNWGQDQLKHMRAGLGLRFDYRVNEATRIYFNSMYSLYEDQLNRRQPTLSTAAAANVVSFDELVTVTRNQTFSLNQNLRNRDIETYNFQFGGESNILGGRLDFTANYSPSEGEEHRFIPVRSVAGVGFRQDRSLDPRRPVLNQVSGPDVYEVRNSTMTSIDMPDIFSSDTIYGAQVNFTRPIQTRIPFTVKTGLRWRDQTREKDQNRRVRSYVGPNGVAGPVGANNDDNLDRFFDPGYTHVAFNFPHGYQFLKLPELMEAIRTSPQLFAEDYAVGTRDSVRLDSKAAETVTAAYLMGDFRFGRLGMVTGVRMEDTQFSGQGYKQEITPEERARRATITGTLTPDEIIRRNLAEFGNRTEADGDYRDYFPSIHFKYQFTPRLLGRLSYSTGIGRPNFNQIVPDMVVNNENLTISSNNPNLQPQYSENFDVALEYYFEPAGLVSVGAFQKNLTDFIFESDAGTLGPDSIFGEAYTGYSLRTEMNGGSAEVRGLEVSYSQQFSNLPGFWKGFGAFANFTWLESEGDYGEPGASVSGTDLVGFTPRTGNVGISYLAHGLTVRAKMNYTGERLDSFNADPSRRSYDKESLPVDLNIAYALNRWLTVYADVINVFNTQTNHQFRYVPERTSRNDLYTTVIKFGVSGTF
jgi:iron complex outermembrane recepter protein